MRYVNGLKDAALGCPSVVFSWQITPITALFEYLRRDFKGMMELDDLVPDSRTVRNLRFGTMHHHEFKRDVSEQQIHDYFPIARRKHDAMCERARRMISDDEPTLYALANSGATDEQLEELKSLLKFRNPSKRFDILALQSTTPDIWQGDDSAWDEEFSHFSFDATLRPVEKMKMGVLRLKSQFIRLRGHLETGKF
jgi:hypothetical protein